MESLSKTKLLDMHTYLLKARRNEERYIELTASGLTPSWIHSELGQESVGVGVALATSPQDYITYNHRGRSILEPRGVDLRRFMAEYLCRKDGLLGGKLGEFFINDFVSGDIPKYQMSAFLMAIFFTPTLFVPTFLVATFLVTAFLVTAFLATTFFATFLTFLVVFKVRFFFACAFFFVVIDLLQMQGDIRKSQERDQVNLFHPQYAILLLIYIVQSTVHKIVPPQVEYQGGQEN